MPTDYAFTPSRTAAVLTLIALAVSGCASSADTLDDKQGPQIPCAHHRPAGADTPAAVTRPSDEALLLDGDDVAFVASKLTERLRASELFVDWQQADQHGDTPVAAARIEGTTGLAMEAHSVSNHVETFLVNSAPVDMISLADLEDLRAEVERYQSDAYDSSKPKPGKQLATHYLLAATISGYHSDTEPPEEACYGAVLQVIDVATSEVVFDTDLELVKR